MTLTAIGAPEETKLKSYAPTSIQALCLFYIVLFPVGRNIVLVPVLALWAAAAALRILRIGMGPTRVIATLFVPLFAIGTLFTAVGFVNRNPGTFNAALVWMAAPVLFAVITASQDWKSIRRLYGAIVLGVVGVSLTMISIFFGFGLEVVRALDPEVRVTGSGLGTEIAYNGLSSLIAGVPFIIAMALGQSGRIRIGLLAAAVLGVFAIGVSGRRAALLVLVAVPAISLLVSFLRRARVEALFGAAIIGSLLLVAFPAVATELVDAAADSPSILGFEVAGDAAVRSDQADRLLDHWTASPLIGHGFGATVPGLIRSVERPWNFELQYHALFMQIGLLGIVALSVLWIRHLQMVVRHLRGHPLFPPAAWALTAIVLANSSNPYLQAPGRMWSLFLPAALLSAHFRSSRKERQVVDVGS